MQDAFSDYNFRMMAPSYLPASIDHLMLQQQERQESQHDVDSTFDMKKKQISSTQKKFSENPLLEMAQKFLIVRLAWCHLC